MYALARQRECGAAAPVGHSAVPPRLLPTQVWNINVRYHMDEDPKVLLTTGLSLPPGQCYRRIAWGPDGHIAAACDRMVHFLDARTGEVVDRVEEAHDAAVRLCRKFRCR